MEYLKKEILIISIPLLIFLFLLLYLYIKKILSYKKIYNKYKDVINIDKEVEKKESEFANLKNKFDKLDDEYNQKNTELNVEYQSKRRIYEQLINEISILEEDLEFTTYGIYKPHFNFDTSEQYKIKVEEIRKKQKQLIKEKTAVVCHIEWQVGGSKREGRKMTNLYMKLMLRAFNNECDASILKVKWNNILKMEERIKKAFEAINKLGATHNIDINYNYLNLKLDELHLAHEYQEKLYEEKEEQRRIREQMREEEKVQNEIEKAKKEAEDEEKKYQKALNQAKDELNKAKGEELEKLNNEIALLQEQLKDAQDKKDVAISRAQMTKSGHIYIISNIGSFGDNVYKIGMTRRLEPIDRVKELGDASVPFSFDIHAMIYSENAPELENDLHNTFNKKRLNMINNRKEFFKVTLNEIVDFVKEKRDNIEFTKIAEAKEYHETLALIEKENNKKSIEEKIDEKFPSSL